MILDMIIPQYNEDESVIVTLLDSISDQKNVDFNEIKVTIVNDKSNVILKDEFLNDYKKLNINYIINDKNTGPGLARQKGIDNTNYPYIMFLDADDTLFSDLVLAKILDYLKQNNPKYVVTNICMEARTNDGLKTSIKKMRDTFPWMHGKVYQRKFLFDNDIRFSNKVRDLEDSYFTTCILGVISKDEISYLDLTTYIWKENKESLTRVKRKYHYTVEIFDDFILCAKETYDFLASKKSKLRFSYFIESTMGIFIMLNSDLFKDEGLKEKRELYYKDLVSYMNSKKNIFKMASKESIYSLYKIELETLKLRNGIKEVYKTLDDFLKILE